MPLPQLILVGEGDGGGIAVDDEGTKGGGEVVISTGGGGGVVVRIVQGAHVEHTSGASGLVDGDLLATDNFRPGVALGIVHGEDSPQGHPGIFAVVHPRGGGGSAACIQIGVGVGDGEAIQIDTAVYRLV